VNKDLVVMPLKNLINDKPTWDAFIEEMDALIAKEHKSMESISDTAEIYRHQGAIRTLRQLKYMRDRING
jgi:hypothetical protein